MFSQLSPDIKTIINGKNKINSNSKTICRFRNSMFDFIIGISKDLGFTDLSCKNYWDTNVKFKTIDKENKIEIIQESKNVYETCKKINKNLDSYLSEMLFCFGIPNELILNFIEHLYQTLKNNHSMYPITSVATSIILLQNALYLSFSTIKVYKNILYNLINLKNSEDFKFTINDLNIEDYPNPPLGDDNIEPKKYEFPDELIVGRLEYVKKINGKKQIQKINVEIHLIFNSKYRHNKYIFQKNKNIKLNFMPFKRHVENNLVSCIHGSTCSEPILINWLRENQKLKGDYDKQVMGTFFLNSRKMYIYSNSFLVGTVINTNVYSIKLFERVVLGYFFDHLKKDLPKESDLIIFLSKHLNTIRKLMIPCPGCLMNNELIKKNEFKISWKASDCDSICTRYELPKTKM